MSKNNFTVLVIGDKPEELMQLYDKNLEVEPYFIFNKTHDINNIKEGYLNTAKMFIDNMTDEKDKSKSIEYYNDLKNKSTDDFFKYISAGCIFDIKTGDVFSTENKDGVWDNYNIGSENCQTLILKDESVSSQAMLSEVDWDAMFEQDLYKYETAWDVVVDKKTPETDIETQIFNNMKDNLDYFKLFSSKKEYLDYCCLFKTTSVLTNDGKWHEMDSESSEIEWVLNYHKTFIDPISDDALLTIYEFSII